MKIAVFFPRSVAASWNLCDGIVATLKRMGHEARACPLPAAQEIGKAEFEGLKANLPPAGELASFDAILISGPEHIAPWLSELYGKYDWKQASVPKAALYHETMFREDFGAVNFDEMQFWADEHFFPAAQDADFFDQEHLAKGRSHWLPFGVDTEIFAPWSNECRCGSEHNPYNIAFIGGIYDKRAAFLNRLGEHDHPPIHVGNCLHQDLGGVRMRETTQLYADNIRQVKVFLNLPALSRLLVTKVFEVMACGTFLLTPMLPPERGADKNMRLFENGTDLLYYRPANLPGLAQMLREWSSEEKAAEREKIARAGCEKVHRGHRLDMRLETVLEKLGCKVAV